MDGGPAALDLAPAGDSRPEGPARPSPAHRRAARDRRGDWLAPTVTFFVLFVASLATLALVRHQGVGIGGDEPFYLSAALAMGRFHTLNMDPAFHYAVAHHIIFPWHVPPGGSVDAVASQSPPVVRHGILFPNHAMGLSVLLALPMVLGTRAALVVLIAALCALAVVAVRLALVVAGVRSPWGYAIGLLFLAPVYLLASTQVYPDLATGLSLAVVLLLLAVVELHGHLSPPQVAGGAALLAILPWLHQQNAFYVVLLLAATGVLYVRTRLPRTQLLWFIGPAALSLVALVTFNLWAFGHPLGTEQGVSLVSLATVTRAAALIVDRRQGVLAGLPVALLGVAGLWLVRRRTPIFAVATAVLFVATVYGNATQVVSFGGGSFIGRFMWPTVPLLLILAGIYLVRLWDVRPRLVVGIGVVGALLFVVQALPVLRDQHRYFNQVAWDPVRYAGWWGGLDPSPVLGYLGHTTLSSYLSVASNAPTSVPAWVGTAHPWANARNLWGTGCVLALAALAVYVLVHLVRKPMALNARWLGILGGTVLVTLVATWHSSALLPGPATWTATSFLSETGTVHGTSRVVTASSGAGAVVLGPYWTLLPGRYRATVYYTVSGRQPERSQMTVTAITKPPDQGLETLASVPLTAASTRSASFTVTQPETVVVSVRWNGGGYLRVDRVGLAKTGQR